MSFGNRVEGDGGGQIGVPGRTNGAKGIPVLTPSFGFARLQEAKVRLIVRIDPGHDFDVRTEFALGVAVGQIAIPRVAEVVIAPRPLFLAGRDVVVGNVNDAGLRGVIVAAKEIFLAAHAHVGGGHGDVGVEGQVVGGVMGQTGNRRLAGVRRDELGGHFGGGDAFGTAFAVVHTVIMALGQGIFAGGAFGVVGDVIDVRREKALVGFMHAGGHIGPPEEALHTGRAIVGARLEFHETFAGMQANAVHAFHAGHRIVVAAPDSFGAIGVLLDFIVRRQKGGRAVMLRPVEFNAAGNPRSRQSHQRGFDDVLIVYQVVTVRLILNGVDTTADFRQH